MAKFTIFAGKLELSHIYQDWLLAAHFANAPTFHFH